jgi:hypothetical protein
MAYYAVKAGFSIEVSGIEYKEGEVVNLDLQEVVRHAPYVEAIANPGSFAEPEVLEKNFSVPFGTDLDYSFYLNFEERDRRITAISKTNPAQITTAQLHNIGNGDWINLFDTDTQPPIDGNYQATIVNPFNFTVPVNALTLGTSGLMAVPATYPNTTWTSSLYKLKTTTIYLTGSQNAYCYENNDYVDFIADDPGDALKLRVGDRVLVSGDGGTGRAILAIGAPSDYERKTRVRCLLESSPKKTIVNAPWSANRTKLINEIDPIPLAQSIAVTVDNNTGLFRLFLNWNPNFVQGQSYPYRIFKIVASVQSLFAYGVVRIV